MYFGNNQGNDPMRMGHFNMDSLFSFPTREQNNQPEQPERPEQNNQTTQRVTNGQPLQGKQYASPDYPGQGNRNPWDWYYDAQNQQNQQTNQNVQNMCQDQQFKYDPNKTIPGMMQTVSIDARCFPPGQFVHLSKTGKQSNPARLPGDMFRYVLHYASTRMLPDEIDCMVRYCCGQYMTVIFIDATYVVCELLITLDDLYNGAVKVCSIYVDDEPASTPNGINPKSIVDDMIK